VALKLKTGIKVNFFVLFI